MSRIKFNRPVYLGMRRHILSHDQSGAKQKVIHVVRQYGVDDLETI
jgi:hypothetical protein